MDTFKKRKAVRALLGALALFAGAGGLLLGSVAVGLIALILSAVLYGPELDALLSD